MYSPNYQINSPDDEDEDQPEDGDISLISTAMQHGGFDSDSIRVKRRKTDFNGGGGRVVQPTGRKDHHSKVRTARGPRDRRVRLSPRTAIQFYDVQDRLGYDRPSKAIDWLINEAKAAIDELEELPTVAQDQGGFLFSGNPVSGFCFDGAASAAPSTTEFQGFVGPGDFALHQSYPHGFCYETNWDMARGGGGGGGGAGWCSAVNYPPPAQPVSGQSQREPLQSSFINYFPMNNDFAGFNFCNELSNITASATMKYDERERKQVYSEPASPFLHNQD